MKVNKIQGIVFKGVSIESHAHRGGWSPDKAEFSGAQDIFKLTDKPFDIKIGENVEKEEIKYVITSNLDCMDFKDGVKPKASEIEGNLVMLADRKLCSKNVPLVVCETGYGNPKNIDTILKGYKGQFAGLKFHPEAFKQYADSPIYEDYMKIAQKNYLPCVFHSGQVGSYSCPKKIYATAKKFKNTPVVMAHMGIGTNHEDATKVLLESIERSDAKLYGDTSWMGPDDIVRLIKELKETSKGDMTERLLFGTDAPLGEFGDPIRKVEGYYADYIGNIKTAIKNNFGEDADEIIDKIFYKNANELFFKKDWAKNIDEGVKKLSKTKIGALFGAGALAVLGIIMLIKGKTKVTKPEVVQNVMSNVMQNVSQNVAGAVVPKLNQNMPEVFKNFA